MNDYALVEVLLAKMYKVMIILRCNDYAKAIYVQMQIMAYHRMQDSFFWKMMQQNICAFNEEGGEVTFSVLSRLVVGDSTRDYFEHIDKHYYLLHLYRQTNEDVFNDIGDPLIKHNHYKIPQDGEEVQAVAAYFLDKIRELRSNWFLVYTGTKKSYARKNQEMVRVQAADKVKKLWIDDISPVVDQHSAACDNKLNGFWLTQFTAIWPEAIQVVSPIRSDDEEIFSEAADETDSEREEDVAEVINDVRSPIRDNEIPPELAHVPEGDEEDAKDENADGDGASDRSLDEEYSDDEQPSVLQRPRVSDLYSEQFMRAVVNSPRKRSRRQASESSSYPMVNE